MISPPKKLQLLFYYNNDNTDLWRNCKDKQISRFETVHFVLRYSPYETAELDEGDGQHGPSPFRAFRHCLWFSVASWVQQGCDFLPRCQLNKTQNTLKLQKTTICK